MSLPGTPPSQTCKPGINLSSRSQVQGRRHRWARRRRLVGVVSCLLTASHPADQTIPVQSCQDAGITVHNFSEFLGGSSGEEVTAVPPKPDDLCCIMYTRWARVLELGFLDVGLVWVRIAAGMMKGRTGRWVLQLHSTFWTATKLTLLG